MSTSDTDLHEVAAVPTGIQRLSQLATVVLDEHVNDSGLCALCGCAFPCDLAVLAEHNTALL
jgi:hypothetical protein